MLIVFAMDSMFFARRQTTWLRRWTRFLHTREHGMHPLDSAIFFTEMGLTLYRSRVFTEKDLEEEWFLAQSLDAQEDDKRFFYFETVSAGEWSYDERLKELEEPAHDPEPTIEESPASGTKSSEDLILELKRKHGLI